MKLEACLLLLTNCVVWGLRRGPHHPHGQTPVEQKHHHYKPRHSESLTGDTQLLHDRKHIEEDSSVLTAEMLAKMSPEELEFHYFSAHDFDKNSKLDGLELLKAVYHTIEHEEADPDADTSIEPESNDLDAYIAIVDRTLESDDTDGDGFVSYAEYRAARANNPSERTPHVLAA
ncbi:multiple coagulation factor deficiency protein 2 homolog [Pectinophora gossypiella]|uniref:multiple coagulation factor deficiency protein 2 homolog n=1 Tax=Pectinophora gossypiella TaxID=13191 RepID=UPI00214EA6F4|nr:multiple coagulation factor deficiency protein 2 homolog [Pectinophora gossypiella]